MILYKRFKNSHDFFCFPCTSIVLQITVDNVANFIVLYLHHYFPCRFFESFTDTSKDSCCCFQQRGFKTPVFNPFHDFIAIFVMTQKSFIHRVTCCNMCGVICVLFSSPSHSWNISALYRIDKSGERVLSWGAQVLV